MPFCEHCGTKINNQSKFCDNCGRKVEVFGFLPMFSQFQNWLLRYGKRIRFSITVVIALLLLLTGGFFVQRYLKNQAAQTAQLQNQITSIQKQAEATQQINATATQSLTSELNAEKDATAKAEQQAQLAQQALALANQQPKSTVIKEDNSFPSINTQAIVLIVCFDDSGKPLQSGSGTIVNSQGYILTNKHVITDETTGNQLTCGAFMNDGSASPALQTGIIYSLTTDAPGAGYYANYDAALLKINGALDTKNDTTAGLPNTFPYIKPAGGNLKEGDSLYIFGYPGASNLVFNVTHGIVSSFSSDGLYINTDAVIDHGNSGGAAITSDGRFVGIPSQKYSSSDGDYLGQILKIENLNIPN